MKYKIISTRQVGDILFTTVEYNFAGTKRIVEVAHSSPESNEEIVTNIINRAATEHAKMLSEQNIFNLINTLPIGEENNIE